jgi:hypothetical protein
MQVRHDSIQVIFDVSLHLKVACWVGFFLRLTHEKLYEVGGKYHSHFGTHDTKKSSSSTTMPRPTKLQSYQTILVAFFSFKDGIAYDKDHIFDANIRASITPNDVVRYL